MVRRPSDEPRAQAQRRAQQKYRLSAQGAWIINTEAFGVRPIDLVARAPDRLREFATLNEAVQFELECYDARQQDPARYQTIPKKNLDLPPEQRALATSVQTTVTEARDHLVDNQAREADAQHARHDETQHELRSLRASVDAAVVPAYGPDLARATPAQLKKRKAAHAQSFDAMIAEAKKRESELRQLSLAELRSRLAAAGQETSGPKSVLMQRLQNAAGSPAAGSDLSTAPRTEAQAVDGASPPTAAPPQPSEGFATPLSAQSATVAYLLRGADELVRQGQLGPRAREHYFSAMKQHYEPFHMQPLSVESAGLVQLKALCQLLKLPTPNFNSIAGAREAIAKKRVGADDFRVAQFLAEQTAESATALAAQPHLLDAGSVVRHVTKHVVETAMILGPVIFADEAADGRATLVPAYRVWSLDDMRGGYAKRISEVLLRAPSRPWLPARLELWRAPVTAQAFAEQVRREGRCFLRTAELIDIARRLGLALPDTRHETVVRVICAWAAEACLEHVRSQLRGFVLYAIVPSSAAHTKRFKISAAWRGKGGYHNIFSVPTANDAWTSEATRAAPFCVDDFYVGAPPGCTAVLSNASKRKGEMCGRLYCKRHRKDVASNSSTAAPSTSGGSSPASAGSQNENSPAA